MNRKTVNIGATLEIYTLVVKTTFLKKKTNTGAITVCTFKIRRRAEEPHHGR